MPLLKPSTNPRAVCVQALQRWESGEIFADEVLHDALATGHFTPFDRAFLTETFYGVLRHRSALDFLIGELRDAHLDAQTRQILRLGFYQLFRMRIPHHAAVNETVNLAGRARGVVNALLRRSIRESGELLARLEAAPASVRYSHPAFLIRRWVAQYGTEAAEALCRWNNQPAQVYARANGLRVTRGELLRVRPATEAGHPAMFRVRQVPHDWIARGLCYIQDPSTLIAAELLGAQPGETVLDACAAPGGKTGVIAEAMGNTGTLHACDVSRPRLERLRENLRRLGVTNAQCACVDWTAAGIPFEPGSMDRILLDAPCSNSGVIRRRVDVRWRLTPEDFPTMAARQRELVEAVLPLLKPGGVLVYGTCSLEAEENDQLVDAVLADHPELECTERRRSTPQDDGIDGAFAARLVKRKA